MIIIEQNDGQLISKRLIDFTTMQLIQLVQLENEKIVGALTESSIIIWSLLINQLHIEYIDHNIHKQKINSICSISDNRIVSCSNVQIIIVLNGEPPYEIIIQIDLSLYHLKQCKVLKQINENYNISSLYDSTICVWDLRIYQLVTVVENKTDNSKQDYFYAFDDKRLIMQKDNSDITFVFNTSTWEIIDEIKFSGHLLSAEKINADAIFCQLDSLYFSVYDIKRKELTRSSIAFFYQTIGLIRLNEYTYATPNKVGITAFTF